MTDASSAPPPTTPASSFWSTCARLIAAYPTRPRALTQAAEPYALRDLLDEQAAALGAALAPGPWRVDASVGRSTWAALPWVAFLDPRHTTTVRQGVFVVVQLLWQGAGGVRLGLAVAHGEAGNGSLGRAADVARDLAAMGELEELRARGFALPAARRPGEDDDDHDRWLAHSFARGLVVEKTVPVVGLRADAARALDGDARALLLAYRRWVELHAADPVRPDPDRALPDLRHALDALAAAAARRRLTYPAELLEALLLSLKTTRLVVLAGAPGTGKTALALLLGDLGARVTVAARLDGEEDLARRVEEADRDPLRQHVLLLEDPPPRRTERALARWLAGERRTDGLTIVWTTARGAPLPPRIVDRADVLRLEPPGPVALARWELEAEKVAEVPGSLAPALLHGVPSRARDGATPAAAAARAVLGDVLAPTQEALRRHGARAVLSWRACDDVFAYVVAALEADLGPAAVRRATDQQLRQRVLPLLLDGRAPLPAGLAEELVARWSQVAQGPGSAADALARAAAREAATGRPASCWDSTAD